MTSCSICKKNEVDSNCQIIFNWKGNEKRGPYYTCIFCWDDLGSLLDSEVSLPYSGNNLKISLKDDDVEGPLTIFDYIPTKCVNCGSKNLYEMVGTKLNNVERHNRTCRDCSVIMFLKEGLK